MNRNDLLTNIDNANALEKLYRSNKSAFKTEFNLLYPELTDHQLADYWSERLNYKTADLNWGSRGEKTFVLIASLLAGVIAKLPALLQLNPENFYQRNIGFIVFPILAGYFIWHQRPSMKKIALAVLALLAGLIFINLLPADSKSNTLILSCIHLPLFLWSVVGFAYVSNDISSHSKRLDFLRYNGDLLVMTGLLAIAGGILTAITVGLFSVIGFDITAFYFDYIVTFGAAALPMVATYLTQSNPQLISRVSPLIAKIFSPLLLVTLVVYLGAILFSGKDPYKDRDFLILFNFLLIGVMAIIIFSVTETARKTENRLSHFILLALSTVTVLVNGIALSAILYRISEWGITPNRLAVLGANLLMLTNLLMVTFQLFKNISNRATTSAVENSISKFLPIYIVWTVIVMFIFPLLFHFK